MNVVHLIGRLTKDPEFRQTKEGREVCRYCLAVNKEIKRDGGPTANFINIITFGKTASFASEYLKKGMLIRISGSIETGSYKGKDGKTVYTTDVIATAHEFLEAKKKEADPEEDAPWR